MKKEVTTFTKKIAGSMMLAAVLAIPAVGSAAEIKYTMPKPVAPAANQEIASCIGVSEIVINVPGGGDFGIEHIVKTAPAVTISLDGNVVQTISASVVEYSPQDANYFVIRPETLTEPGTYTVDIPQSLVQMALDTSSVDTSVEEGEELPIYYNAAYSYSFKIVAMPEFSISPLPGLYTPDQLRQIKFSLPEGSEVSKGSSSSPIALMLYDYYENTTSRATTYTASYNGNVVTLTADTPSSIKALDKSISREWYYVLIPKNALNINLDGRTYSNPALEFEKYDIRVFGAEGFSISPSPAEGLLPVDVREFTISYPTKYELDTSVKVGSTIAYLTQTGNTEASRMKYSGFQFGNLRVTAIDDANRTITMKMDDPETSFSYENNPDLMETSYYCVSFTSRVFKGLKSLNFPGYHVTGKEGCSLSGLTVVVNNEPREDFKLDFGESFSQFNVYYPFEMVKTGTPGDITITQNGQVAASLSSSEISLPSGGDKYMVFKFKKTIRSKGVYYLNIPAGIFKQTSYDGYPNLAQSIKITIGDVNDDDGPNSAVEELEVEDAQPVYYTLDGRIANAKKLAPGLYIVRKGAVATKILVK